MKVLVTGGCGFIGVHACEFFCRQGWAVIAYDNMTKFELDRTGYRADAARDYNWNWLGELGVERVIGDIRDLEQILDCSSGCDFIVHTAAQQAVTISIEEPLVDLKTNVLGTVHVLEAARKHSIPADSRQPLAMSASDILPKWRIVTSSFVISFTGTRLK